MPTVADPERNHPIAGMTNSLPARRYAANPPDPIQNQQGLWKHG